MKLHRNQKSLKLKRHTALGAQHGQSLVVIAFALIALLAFAGLVLDGGNAYAQRRRMQNAADAGSIAGTNVLSQGITNDSQVYAAVYNYTVTRNGAGSFIATYYPGGQSVGGGSVPGDVQGVIVTASVTFPTFFLNVVGISQGSAAGGSGANIQGGYKAYRCAVIGLQVSQSAESVELEKPIHVQNGCVYSNGNLEAEGTDPGGKGDPNNWPHINGNAYAHGPTIDPYIKFEPTGTYQAYNNSPIFPTPYTDPHLEPPVPQNAGACTLNPPHTYTCTPGRYSSITITDNDNYTFQPGVYYFTGTGFHCSGNASASDNGGPVSFILGGNSNFETDDSESPKVCSLTFTTGRIYNNFLIYAESGGSHEVDLDGGPDHLNGTIYDPFGEVELDGKASQQVNGQIVGNTVELEGATTTVTYDANYVPPAPPHIFQ